MFDQGPGAALSRDAGARDLHTYIGQAWSSDDAWLRACAVRAARAVPEEDLNRFTAVDPIHSLVASELTALRDLQTAQPEALRAAGAGTGSC
jgi:hypothetical protein